MTSERKQTSADLTFSFYWATFASDFELTRDFDNFSRRKVLINFAALHSKSNTADKYLELSQTCA